MTTTNTRLAVRVRLVIAATVAVGVGCIAARLPEVARWSGRDVLAFGGLAAAGVLLEQLTISLRHGTETQNWEPTDSLWAAALLLARPSVLTLGVATGVGVGELIRRRPAYKVAFNVGQFVAGMTVAELIYSALHPGARVDAAAMGAAVAAVLGYLVVNSIAVAFVISLAERASFARTLAAPFGLTAMQWSGNMAVGIVGAVVWTRSVPALPLLGVALAMCCVAYRARLRVLGQGPMYVSQPR